MQRIVAVLALLLIVPVVHGQETWEEASASGKTAYERSDLEAAQRHFAQALHRAESFDAGDPRLSASLVSLANVHRARGEFAEAERHLNRAVALRRAALGQDHPKVADALNDLAVLHQLWGKKDPEPIYNQVVAIRTRALGAEDLSVAEALNNLGSLRYAKAHRLSGRRPGLSLVVDPGAVAAVNGNPGALGVAVMLSGEQSRRAMKGTVASLYTAAEEGFRRALTIQEKALGDLDPRLAPTIFNLGSVNLVQQDWAESQHFFARLVEIDRKRYGAHDVRLSPTLESLAYASFLGGKTDEGERAWEGAIDLRRQSGAGAGELGATWNNLAVFHHRRGDLRGADSAFQKAVALYEAARAEPRQFATVLDNYAVVLRGLKSKAEAAQLEARARKMRESR